MDINEIIYVINGDFKHPKAQIKWNWGRDNREYQGDKAIIENRTRNGERSQQLRCFD